MDKVNVIVPCYNYSNYLDLCLMSIFTQRTNFEVEILFSDDNSSDESFGIAERISRLYSNENIHLRAFKQEKNIGEIENTKFLLNKCTGKYVAYLDADDYWINPYKLQRQFDLMEENSECSMCYTGQLGYDGTHHGPDPTGFSSIIAPFYFINTGRLNFDRYDYGLGVLDCETFFSGNHVFSSSRFFKNYPDLFKDYFYEFPYSDWPMNFELGRRGKIYYMGFASYVYRLKPDSLYHKKMMEDSKDKNDSRFILLKSIWDNNSFPSV